MKSIIKFYSILFLHSLIINVYGQYITYSPYTRYGIGDIYFDTPGFLKSLGGSSTAFRQNNKINYSNPASYSEQDTLSFIFNFDFDINNQEFKTNDNNKISYKNFNISGIAIGFPITKGLVLSTGIVPYSKVGYNLLYEGTFENNEIYNQYFEGKGGINRLYIGTGLALNKYLSLGCNASYLFGSIYHNSRALVPPTDGSALTIYKDEVWHSGWSYNAGTQIIIPIKNTKFICGATYEFKSNINYEKSTYIFSEYIESADSISYIENGKIKIPQKYSLGLSFLSNKLNLYFDYKLQKWSNFIFYNNSNFNNSKIISGGIEFTPVPLKEIKKSTYWERITFRTGIYKKDLYWKINNEILTEYGINFGVGLPWINERRLLTNTSINITYTYMWRAKNENKLIKENNHIININLSLYDFWFFKSKYE